MGKVYTAIEGDIADFILRQKVYFVATAPLDGEGHINLSPKGLDGFRLLGPRRAAYLDLTGSGIETLAHVRENGRIVVMFCAFDGPAKIVRLHGRANGHQKGSAGYQALLPHFEDMPGARAIIEISVERISDSCGWGVPLYAHTGERDQLTRYSLHHGEAALETIRLQSNAENLDGLPGYLPAR